MNLENALWTWAVVLTALVVILAGLGRHLVAAIVATPVVLLISISWMLHRTRQPVVRTTRAGETR